MLIHHNYFADRTPINEVNDDNNQDAIRIGNSSTSLDDSFSEVYDNYFVNFFGEIEVISNKSGNNKYYNNTFRNYSGSLTLRHGDNCEVYGNYFFADDNLYSGGVRVIGEGHKVYNNYIEGINSTKPDGSTSSATGGINVSNGRQDSELNGYYQVKNTDIINNTFVNCDYAVRVGTKVKSDLDLAPENLTVANNIMYNTTENAYQIITSPTGNSPSEGNITNLSDSDLANDGAFYRLSSGSAAVDAAMGSYPYLTRDILGGSRESNYDAGAEEFGADGMNFPYNELDLGVNIGFGAISQPTLSADPLELVFDENGGTMTFSTVSNVDWVIEENIDWMSIDASSGSGTALLEVTVPKNTTGIVRSASFFINEVAGGNDLSTEVTITQLNTFIPQEIPIVGTSSLGMQDKEEIEEVNSYDDDLATYWTGDPDTEPEVSITFDLECKHELTEIGIHFWKADERTTTFSIGKSNEANGPFDIVINEATSADAGVTVGTEQIFDLSGVKARYVKFIGIGNSSSTNWTSIANVNIYGNTACDDATNTTTIQSGEEAITLFPVPAYGDFLQVLASEKPLNLVQIYTMTGEKLLMRDGQGKKSMQIDISKLQPGVYILSIEDIGTRKFVKL